MIRGEYNYGLITECLCSEVPAITLNSSQRITYVIISVGGVQKFDGAFATKCLMVPRFGDGPNTVSESTVSTHRTQWDFCPHWAPGRELSEFLSAYYLCAKANSPSFSQNSLSVLRNWVRLSEFSSPKQYSRNSSLPFSYRFRCLKRGVLLQGGFATMKRWGDGDDEDSPSSSSLKTFAALIN